MSDKLEQVDHVEELNEVFQYLAFQDEHELAQKVSDAGVYINTLEIRLRRSGSGA